MSNQIAILIMAHTDVQVDVFLRQHKIPRHFVHRIREEHDLCGWKREVPIVLLPEYQMHGDAAHTRALLRHWDSQGGRIIEVKEEQVLGKQPICPNDTNGDGDCLYCAKSGVCKWPHHPQFPLKP